jgi:hypothetical protein
MVAANTTYRCAHCTQLLPFDERVRVPDACLRRCQGSCDWHAVGPTDPAVRALASLEGELGPDGLPVADGAA